MDILYEFKKLREKLVMWFVWKLPRRLVYWATIRLWAHATTCPEGCNETPDETNFFDALRRWETS